MTTTSVRTLRARIISAGVCAIGISLANAASAQMPSSPDLRAGGFLASNCANCHGTLGTAQGAMPSLAGQPKTFIVEQMRAFRDGKRPATIMHQLAKGYTDQQIEVIAEFYSRQKPAR